MDKNKKIAIIGANGIGKTTLLKTLMKVINPIEGKVMLDEQHLDIGYYEQENYYTENVYRSGNQPVQFSYDDCPKNFCNRFFFWHVIFVLRVR